ncbi:MAG: DpnD/PcfM family protein [Lachnospiraceae bacterium]
MNINSWKQSAGMFNVPAYFFERGDEITMNMNRVEYLGKMEKVLDIPAKDRLTKWYEDFNIYEPKINVTMAQINDRIRELSKELKQGSKCIVEIKETLSRKIEVVNPDSIDDAIDTVMQSYNNGNIVLDADDFQSVEFNELDFECEP